MSDASARHSGDRGNGGHRRERANGQSVTRTDGGGGVMNTDIFITVGKWVASGTDATDREVSKACDVLHPRGPTGIHGGETVRILRVV